MSYVFIALPAISNSLWVNMSCLSLMLTLPGVQQHKTLCSSLKQPPGTQAERQWLCVFSQRHRRRERARERKRKMSPAPNPSCQSYERAWFNPSVLCVTFHPNTTTLLTVLEAERRRGAFTTSLWPRLLSGVYTFHSWPIRHLVHFFLPDFSERFASDFPPRSDLSDRSPLSLSFSFSLSFSLSLSARSIRSEPPRSDRLSALLPSRRVPSSVDEVVGWGWPHLAISSCSVILAVMLFTHALRSSCKKKGDHRCQLMFLYVTQVTYKKKKVTAFWRCK